ncbi:hypothetical protein FTI75_25960 [Burkholderia pseudomallei]|uniref:hypothetical protein n=1 Tax=Burkholderia pseudomallei TaxID=28450 RepID=UPI0011BA27BC|nr:hypothetical protein [Burkholderia pseudomallei]TXD01807.1 hypothetical protein FTI75_25960 [Burkholderia pseudomallei]
MKSTHRKSHTKRPIEMQRALDAITRAVSGFDRLTCWIDHPAPEIPVPRVQRYCGEVTITNCYSLPFHPAWQTQVMLFQPSRQALIELQHAFKSRHRIRMGYAELALDWLVADHDAADVFYSFILKHMRVPYLRHAVTFEERTAYFAPRATDDLSKSARNVALYADRPSKLWSARQDRSPCCHLEHRFQGVDTLAQRGLLSLEDCIRFDHRAYWAEHLRLFRLPSKVELGRWLNPDSIDVSDTALAKRADRFLGRYSYGDTFVLQDCWLGNPSIANVLTPIDNAPFLVA